MMGRGKSWSAINYMNSHHDEKFLYVTPYLDEIEQRIIPCCPEKKFTTPDAKKGGTKTRHLKKLLNKGTNIAATHALFKLFDQEAIDICRNQNYVLIMDEVSEVVSEYNITREDLNTLLEKYVDVDQETKLFHWKENKDDYHGKFAEEKRLCDMKCLGQYGNDVMMWLFPVEAFNAFSKIYILTYLFSAQIQKYYYDYYGLPYTYICVDGDSIDTYHFSNKSSKSQPKYDFNKLIHICDNEKLNTIGERETDLSKSWYMRNCAANNYVIKKLKDNLFNYFHNIMNSPTENNLWTTFSDYRKFVSGKGYARGFIPSNSRATNNYRTRSVLAYPINKFMHTYVKGFFVSNGITVDEEGYALSEMLQWIWRSAIRDGREIWIYIPSQRMRGLLQNWINKISDETNT